MESTVTVKDKGVISIKDLQIGDMVLSDEAGTYSKFYSKGHYDETKSTEFLRIVTELTAKPIELTPSHMVFKASSDLPAPAHSIKVGDVLETTNGPSKVKSIRKITRKGLFNPLTLSGTIVVDGVVSSAHSEEPGFEGADAGWIYLEGFKIVHWHKLTHWIHAPHRIIYGWSTSCFESQNEDGLIPFHEFLETLERTAAEKQSTVFSVFVLSSVVIVALFFLILEVLLKRAAMFAAICSIFVGWHVFKKLQVKVKAKVA